MAELLRPDLCVIGGGAGGLSVAAAAAAFDRTVVLIEKGDMGGEALHRAGALPMHALLAAATRAEVLRRSAPFGVKAARPSADFAAVKAHARSVVGAMAPNFTPARITGLGARVIKGTARFIDAETVAVGEVTVKARRFVIATGSVPLIPAIPGLAGAPYSTAESVFDLAECPRHLIVIGAGTRGLELAQAFRRLGSEVTVLEEATPLAGEDREAADILLRALEREGVKLRTGIEIAKVARSLARLQVVLATAAGVETIEGSHLLLAAGRRPNLEDLDLDAAGIRHRPDGIIVDRRLLTTNKRVYAIGEAAGAPAFVHLAHHHAGVVVRRDVFGLRVTVDDRPVPRVTHTDPELAHVGLTEDEARAKHKAFRVSRWPYRENDRAQAERATTGHIKVITNRYGEIIGATIVGARAAENITTWTLAVSQRMNIRALAGLVVPYPTYAEVGKRAAITYFSHGLTRPLVHRIIGWLRRSG